MTHLPGWIKCRFWLSESWWDSEFAVLTASQVMVILLVKGPHFEQQCPRQGRTFWHLQAPVDYRCAVLATAQPAVCEMVQLEPGLRTESHQAYLFVQWDETSMCAQVLKNVGKPCPRILAIQSYQVPGLVFSPLCWSFPSTGYLIGITFTIHIWNLTYDTFLHGYASSFMPYSCRGTIFHPVTKGINMRLILDHSLWSSTSKQRTRLFFFFGHFSYCSFLSIFGMSYCINRFLLSLRPVFPFPTVNILSVKFSILLPFFG